MPKNWSKRGTIVEFALILPLLLFLIFVVFDLGSIQVVDHASFSAAREGARSYARTGDVNASRTSAQNTFNTMASNFGTIQSVEFYHVNRSGQSFIEAVVTARVTANHFSFAWKFLGQQPTVNVIQKRMIYPIEEKQGSEEFWN